MQRGAVRLDMLHHGLRRGAPEAFEKIQRVVGTGNLREQRRQSGPQRGGQPRCRIARFASAARGSLKTMFANAASISLRA